MYFCQSPLAPQLDCEGDGNEQSSYTSEAVIQLPLAQFLLMEMLGVAL